MSSMSGGPRPTADRSTFLATDIPKGGFLHLCRCTKTGMSREQSIPTKEFISRGSLVVVAFVVAPWTQHFRTPDEAPTPAPLGTRREG